MMKLSIFNFNLLIIFSLVLVASILPLVISIHDIYYLTYSLVLTISAMGFNLIFKYGGLLSLGNAIFVGTSAYTIAILTNHLNFSLTPLLMLAGIAMATITSAVLGYICLRASGIHFAILTLAFGELFYILAVKLRSITNGTDGLGIPNIPLLFGTTYDVNTVYYLALMLVVPSIYLLWRITKSPFVLILQGIRDNPIKAKSLGINIMKYQWTAFLISGIYAGLGGIILSFMSLHVVPDYFRWTLSAEIIISCLIGGYGYFLGPAVGAFIFTALKYYLVPYTRYWQLLMGIIVIVIMLLFKKGVLGSIQPYLAIRFKSSKYK